MNISHHGYSYNFTIHDIIIVISKEIDINYQIL